MKGKLKAKVTTPESEDDAEFLGSSSEGSSSSDEGDESDEIQILNKEVILTLLTVYGHLIFFQLADSLPSKTIPAGKKQSSKVNGKKKQHPKKCPCHMATDNAHEDVPIVPPTAPMGRGWLFSFCEVAKNLKSVLSLGSAVAVEHIFSGGRDTISLHCASLKLEIIKVLMLVKHQLILRCAKPPRL